MQQVLIDLTTLQTLCYGAPSRGFIWIPITLYFSKGSWLFGGRTCTSQGPHHPWNNIQFKGERQDSRSKVSRIRHYISYNIILWRLTFNLIGGSLIHMPLKLKISTTRWTRGYVQGSSKVLLKHLESSRCNTPIFRLIVIIWYIVNFEYLFIEKY